MKQPARGAASLLTLLIRGAKEDMFEIFGSSLTEIYRLVNIISGLEAMITFFFFAAKAYRGCSPRRCHKVATSIYSEYDL